MGKNTEEKPMSLLKTDSIIEIHDDSDLGIWIDLNGYGTSATMSLIIQETDKEEKILPIHVNVRELVHHLINQL